MKRICAKSGKEFEVSESDLEYYKKISPQIGNEIYEVPPPSLCLEEREMRRMAWRNERTLYKRTCDATGKEIISEYPPDSPFQVVDVRYYYERNWQVPECEFDFERPFFEQFRALLLTTPRPARLTDITSEENNSIYQNCSAMNKNCYLMFASGGCEGCSYAQTVEFCKDTLDGLVVLHSELCYECIDCLRCYQLIFSQECTACTEGAFLYDCRNSHHCFGCIGLRNQKYCLFNQQLSEQEYKTQVVELYQKLKTTSGVRELQTKMQQMLAHTPHRHAHIEDSEDCTGDFIYNSKNVTDSFMVYDSQDCRYCIKLYNGKDCIDVSDFGRPGELMRECITTGQNAYKTFFCNNCWPNCTDLLYCESCKVCRNCFGCTGLKNAEYCILNKQYSKEEYEALVPKIIEHMKKTPLNPPLSGGKNTCEWGEFFPAEHSPFAYNETWSFEYYPLSKAEVQRRGWRWRDEEIEIPKVTKIIPANRLPDSIDDIPDDILNWAIECEETGKPYKIQTSELEYYRKLGIPIPHFHPNVRHTHRMQKRNGRTLRNVSCDNCGSAIQTTRSQQNAKVLCEACYAKQI